MDFFTLTDERYELADFDATLRVFYKSKSSRDQQELSNQSDIKQMKFLGYLEHNL